MWDNATVSHTELNAQTLAHLGVKTGGVINCAVRLYSLSPTSCSTTTPRGNVHSVARRCARCAATTSIRPLRCTCMASSLTLSGIKSGSARPTRARARPTPSRFRTSRRECARCPYRTPIVPPPSPCTAYARTKRVRLDAAALTPTHPTPAGTSITSRRRTRTSACMRGRRTGSGMG